MEDGELVNCDGGGSRTTPLMPPELEAFTLTMPTYIAHLKKILSLFNILRLSVPALTHPLPIYS